MPKVPELQSFDLMGQEFKRVGVRRSELDLEALFPWKLTSFLVTLSSILIIRFKHPRNILAKIIIAKNFFQKKFLYC